MIKKSVTPKYVRVYFQEILKRDILDATTIDYKKILGKVAKFEKEVETSITEDRSTRFFKPEKYSSFSAYAAPYTQGGVRGVIAFNALFPSQAIQNSSRIKTIKLKCKNLEDLQKIEKSFPTEYKILRDTIFDHEYLQKYGFGIIALPFEMETFPEFLIPFIDIEQLILTNIANALQVLKAIGIEIYKNKTNQFSGTFIEF